MSDCRELDAGSENIRSSSGGDLGRRCPFEEPRAPLLLISLKLDEKIVSRAFLVVRLSCRWLGYGRMQQRGFNKIDWSAKFEPRWAFV
jgi:hypothetical protein